VLHACCHNPTGYDITPEDWDKVIAVVKARELTPFLDMAYQGFGYGIAEDGAVIQKFVAAGLNFFVSTSFSKSFSLYGERVGGLSVLCQDKEEAGACYPSSRSSFAPTTLTRQPTAAPWWPPC
jgi:aromatic-amino-acid transaminase